MERYIRCKSGNLLCGECKSDLANNTRTFIIEFKRKREKAKDKVKDFMFEGMMVIAIAGLGVTVTERFATKYNSNKPYYDERNNRETINTRRISGTPLPKYEERER